MLMSSQRRAALLTAQSRKRRSIDRKHGVLKIIFLINRIIPFRLVNSTSFPRLIDGDTSRECHRK